MFNLGEYREIISKWLYKSDWILWFMVDIQLYLMGFINQIIPPGKQAIENQFLMGKPTKNGNFQ